jgi:hypothetical protein
VRRKLETGTLELFASHGWKFNNRLYHAQFLHFLFSNLAAISLKLCNNVNGVCSNVEAGRLFHFLKKSININRCIAKNIFSKEFNDTNLTVEYIGA